MKNEIWKDAKGYDGYYQISNLGDVRSLKKWCGNKYVKKWKYEINLLKQYTHYHGYKYVILTKDKESKKRYVHRLVAEAFIPNPSNKKEINHIDGIKENNKVENLEWSTRSENVLHSYKKGLLKSKRGINNKCSKPVLQYSLDGSFIKSWGSIREASIYLKIRDISISRCCRGLSKRAGEYKWEYADRMRGIIK